MYVTSTLKVHEPVVISLRVSTYYIDVVNRPKLSAWLEVCFL